MTTVSLATSRAGAWVAAVDGARGAHDVGDALERAGVAVAGVLDLTPGREALAAVVDLPGSLLVMLASPDGQGADLARQAVVRALGARPVLSERMLAALTEAAAWRGRPLSRSAERRALLPRGAVVWTPGEGVPPGWAIPRGARPVAVLPGGHEHALRFVPDLVALLGRSGAIGAPVRLVRLAGLALEDVEARVAAALPRLGRGITVGIEAAGGEATLRVRATSAVSSGTSRAGALTERALDDAARELANAFGEDCVGIDGDTLAAVVGRRLAARGLTLAVAESCTGGLVGHRLTEIAGSSAWFERGIVAYSNAAKRELLGVPDDILRVHGAVSSSCAEAMARGAARASGSRAALAVTGIAGPGGGTAQKPVGTVFVAAVVDGQANVLRCRFSGGRGEIKRRSAVAALDLLRRMLR